MNGSGLNHKTAPFQRLAKGFVGRGLLGVDPDDQYTGGTQEVHQPVKRDLKGFERAPPPIDQRYVVLAGRMAAVRRCCRANIAATLQLQHELDALGASNDDSVLLRATCKRNHRFDDAIACRSGMRGSHVSPFLVSLCADAVAGQLAVNQASHANLARVLNAERSLSRGLPTDLEPKVPASDHCLQ